MTSTNVEGTSSTGAGGGGPASNPELAVQRLVAILRASGAHPAVASNFVAEGVLHDVGWALWESIPNPNTGTIVGGGYNHALFHVDAFQYDQDRPSPPPSNLTGQEVGLLKTILTVDRVNLLPAEWPEYAAGATSICTQQMVFSPVDVGSGRFTFYRYPELQTLVNLAQGSGLRVYANVGIANNGQFWTGEYEFNRLYPLKTNTIALPLARDIRERAYRRAGVETGSRWSGAGAVPRERARGIRCPEPQQRRGGLLCSAAAPRAEVGLRERGLPGSRPAATADHRGSRVRSGHWCDRVHRC